MDGVGFCVLLHNGEAEGQEMKEMIYKSKFESEVLHCGEYKGVRFYIISRGMFPCAYVEVPKRYKGINTNDIDCHGGVTYADNKLIVSDTVIMHGFFIGWDYGHCCDHIAVHPSLGLRGGKKWTTEEVFEEVKAVIEQIIGERGDDAGNNR